MARPSLGQAQGLPPPGSDCSLRLLPYRDQLAHLLTMLHIIDALSFCTACWCVSIRVHGAQDPSLCGGGGGGLFLHSPPPTHQTNPKALQVTSRENKKCQQMEVYKQTTTDRKSQPGSSSEDTLTAITAKA